MKTVKRFPAASFAAAALLATALTPAEAGVIEEVVAWVNGEIVTRSELLEREEAMTSQLSARYVGDELEAELKQMRRTLLTDMIREEILMQRAEFLGLELDKVFQQALDQLKQQQGIKTNDELDEVLKKEGISKDELRDTLLRFNVPDIMINLEVREKIVVTDEEAETYYNAHREQFRSAEEFTIREVVITREKHPGEDLQQVVARVVEEVDLGVPFEEIVDKYSEAPSRAKAGLIGPLRRGDLIRAIEEAALALEVGKVSRPIETEAGLHVVRLESHTPARDPSLDEVRPKVIQHLKKERFSAKLQEYLAMLMETNRIEVNPVYQEYSEGS